MPPPAEAAWAQASGSRAWLALCALLAAGAVAAFLLPAPVALLDGQPDRWLREPWRLWTAAWVHWTPLHLAANVAGVVVLALYGQAAALRRAHALAWFIAWPLTHWALALWALRGLPGLAHYGGLSGVLHAGVAVASTALLARPGLQRAVGAAVWAGLLLKLGWETAGLPGSPGARPGGWDFAVATQAHAAGALAGLLCALAVEWHERKKKQP
ncbi:rhomboid family intramembrane serine protease [Azohydromonas caseinilytica]|uniref:Rhomboid family intramembrane serine protease n=1 Tax=Azohydromonas caseinilytica TaxID=2728836 RepID=A0A848FBG9_9BURK|nr:rhomboid family intramembrane serine protease [Azohydromonas caseinilytica]NML16236.1 rhomboid family intramembrane serine protease [Azohydromonas caseinilytica]